MAKKTDKALRLDRVRRGPVISIPVSPKLQRDIKLTAKSAGKPLYIWVPEVLRVACEAARKVLAK